jgi:release factor glutamine methyltransferase
VNKKIIKVDYLIKDAEIKLQKANISTFHLDAKILLAYLLKLRQPEEIIFKLCTPVSKNICHKFANLIERRLNLEPIAYIIGHKDFWKQTYKVSSDVLIPRPETELFIEIILDKLQQQKNEQLHILDLGTGSGCIILSLLSELKNSFGVAVDISQKALHIAKANAKDQQLTSRVKFIQSNWFDALNMRETFDIIVSNPPYISKNEWQSLDINVRNFEPSSALTDAKDGLQNYKIIAENAKNFLNPSGFMLLEIGYNQSTAVKNIFKDNDYKVEYHKDIQGIKRVIAVTAMI